MKFFAKQLNKMNTLFNRRVKGKCNVIVLVAKYCIQSGYHEYTSLCLDCNLPVPLMGMRRHFNQRDCNEI